ncbi:Lrp/AsnC family transcriptional regulator [Geminicoccus roseus]|uniref:Lrp/AsnC family transcriptional regulator n=1 Tax=Geminicoccus roseus TaxID=404900 RepID=UPI00042551DE|nr:Lrp/AsnC family transcriptional regulator [Geminicoccus roseus]
MPRLDEIDRRILAALQADGRISNAELADKVGLSASPCLRRVRALEQAGVIAGYRAILDREAVGLGLTVFVAIKVARHSKDAAAALQEALGGIDEVVACHMVSGEADFLAEMVVADLRQYERILTERLLTLPMVGDIRSNVVLRRIRSDGPLPLAASLDPSTKKAGQVAPAGLSISRTDP